MPRGGSSKMTVLQSEELVIGYGSRNGVPKRAVDHVSFSVEKGETLGIVGESGCGKSTLARGLVGYLRPGGQFMGGDVKLDGDSLLDSTPAKLQQLRGRRMAFVPQNPLSSLTYHMTVGSQLDEILAIHRGMRGRDARDETIKLFKATRLPEPEAIYRRYPHQLSGGQRQRVVIAAALACRPSVMILDEPTTALDTTTEMQVLALVKDLREELDSAIVYITHDLTLTNYMCDRVLVMLDGKVIESGSAARVFDRPEQTYTKDLVAAIPRVDQPPKRKKSIAAAQSTPLLEVENLSFAYRPAWSPAMLFSKQEPSLAVYQVGFTVTRGETLGVVGESGSGKSTIANIVVGLVAPTSGSVRLNGEVLPGLGERRSFEQRRRIQIIFQDPLSSLNPRHRIETILTQPMHTFFGLGPKEARDRAAQLLEQLELPTAVLQSFPRQLSGGQQQRIAIARAFAAEPDLILCDEITSALDVSVQAHVLDLLVGLQEKTGTTCLFISHDLGLVREVAHHSIVLENGAVVENGLTEDIFTNPHHAYTRRLIAAAARRDDTSETPGTEPI